MMKKSTFLRRVASLLTLSICVAATSLAYGADDEATKLTPYSNDASGLASDIKHKVVSASASKAEAGKKIESTIDGVIGGDNFYNAPWDKDPKKVFPVELSYKLGGVALDYIIYYPRCNGGAYGNAKEVDIYIATGKSEAKFFKTYDLKGRNVPSTIQLGESLKGVTEVIFKAKSATGEGSTTLMCSEMEFYSKDRKAYDASKLFADDICSELKPGVTLRDIERCPVEFYRTLARYIYHGEYDAEFRVADIKAWKTPDIESKERRTTPYSLLDNPTGMIAEEGKEFVVLVGEGADNESISLRICDLYDTEVDGYNKTDVVSLNSGVNRITPNRTGLVYILYHADEPSEHPSIAMNFATGVVNGYYDSSRHTQKDWKRLIDGATNQHFDMVGHFVHMTFPTESIKEYAHDNGPEVLAFYNNMVRLEQEFLGFGPQGHRPYFSNRLYMHVGYRERWFMYATSYRTCYNISTMQKVLSMETIRKGAWGTAHEMGHVHQTRPLMKWIGLTEVTNNIMSLYMQSEIMMLETRIATEDQYGKARELRGSGDPIPFSDYDIWGQLCAFWQLYLYNTRILGNKDFYPDMYEMARTLEIPYLDDKKSVDNGACQVRFARIACDAAQLDFTEFFEYWGFFTPTTKEVKDYGTATLTVTEEEVAATKAYIKSKNYPKPDSKHPIWLISDMNYENYR